MNFKCFNEFPIKKLTQNEQETFNLAKEFSKCLQPGDVVAMFGNLGAGKTVFVKGLCQGLKFLGDVISPTFTIINEYENKNVSIVHCDMYRINSYDDLIFCGFFDYLNKKNIVVVEWSENILKFLPKKCFTVKLIYKGENERLIEFNKGV